MNKRVSTKISKLIWFVLGALVGAVSLYLVSHNPPAKTYVYVDVDKVISNLAKEVSLQRLETSAGGQEDMTAKIEQMKQRFERTLTDYEQSHNAIIFSSPKPIKGAVDKTDYFIDKTIRKNKNDGEEQK